MHYKIVSPSSTTPQIGYKPRSDSRARFIALTESLMIKGLVIAPDRLLALIQKRKDYKEAYAFINSTQLRKRINEPQQEEALLRQHCIFTAECLTSMMLNLTCYQQGKNIENMMPYILAALMHKTANCSQINNNLSLKEDQCKTITTIIQRYWNIQDRIEVFQQNGSHPLAIKNYLMKQITKPEELLFFLADAVDAVNTFSKRFLSEHDKTFLIAMADIAEEYGFEVLAYDLRFQLLRITNPKKAEKYETYLQAKYDAETMDMEKRVSLQIKKLYHVVKLAGLSTHAVNITGRVKHPYSLSQKETKNPLEKPMDVLGWTLFFQTHDALIRFYTTLIKATTLTPETETLPKTAAIRAYSGPKGPLARFIKTEQLNWTQKPNGYESIHINIGKLQWAPLQQFFATIGLHSESKAKNFETFYVAIMQGIKDGLHEIKLAASCEELANIELSTFQKYYHKFIEPIQTNVNKYFESSEQNHSLTQQEKTECETEWKQLESFLTHESFSDETKDNSTLPIQLNQLFEQFSFPGASWNLGKKTLQAYSGEIQLRTLDGHHHNVTVASHNRYKNGDETAGICADDSYKIETILEKNSQEKKPDMVLTINENFENIYIKPQQPIYRLLNLLFTQLYDGPKFYPVITRMNNIQRSFNKPEDPKENRLTLKTVIKDGDAFYIESRPGATLKLWLNDHGLSSKKLPIILRAIYKSKYYTINQKEIETYGEKILYEIFSNKKCKKLPQKHLEKMMINIINTITESQSQQLNLHDVIALLGLQLIRTDECINYINLSLHPTKTYRT